MNRGHHLGDPGVTVALVGFSTVIAQSCLLREAMAAMGGSEMAWGVVMTLWLAGVALGSRIGIRVGSPVSARWAPGLALALAGAGAVMFRAAPAIVGAAAGETLTTWHAVWLWSAAVVPTALAGGLAFPVLAGQLGVDGPSRAYALEAAGALAAGAVFSLVLAPLGTPIAVLAGAAVVGGLSLLPARPVSAAVLALSCAVLSIPADRWLTDAGWRWAGRPGRLADRAETRLQRLEISSGPPFSLFLNGRLAASVPDPYSTLPSAHLRMLLHPTPRSVLALGCIADGSLEAMVHHPVRRVVLGETDPGLAPFVRRWFGASFASALDSPLVKATPVAADLTRGLDGPFDLVILADGDPTTLAANRTRTLEFFRACRRLMADDGVIAVEVGVSDTYLGGEAGRLLATVASTLRAVFPSLTAVPGERVLLVAGSSEAGVSADPVVLQDRLEQRPGVESLFDPAMIAVLIDPPRQTRLRGWLETETAARNTVTHPRAVAIAMALHEARAVPGLAGAISDRSGRGRTILGVVAGAMVLLVAATAAAPRRRLRLSSVALVVGSTSMGWWLLLLTVWQATRGSVFSEIGALTGLFMAGVAVGGWTGLRASPPGSRLTVVLVAGVALSLLIASGLPIRAPLLLVPALLVIGGLLTGAAFGPLGRPVGGETTRNSAGLAFCADELGAAAAALTIGTVAIPWVGMTAVAAALAVLGAAAIPAALRSSSTG